MASNGRFSRRVISGLALLTAAWVLAGGVLADVVTKTDGTVLTGTILRETPGDIPTCSFRG